MIKLKPLILLIIFILCDYFLIAQNDQITNDTINKLDSLERKNGYWIEYLTKNFRIAKKAKDAILYRYIRYSHGIRFDLPIVSSHYIYKITLNTNDTSLYKGDIKLLNGTYNLYIKKGSVLIKECVFKNGFLTVLTEYDGEWGKQICYFEEKYKNNKFSYAMKYFSETGKLVRDIFVVLENSKWKTIKRD